MLSVQGEGDKRIYVLENVLVASENPLSVLTAVADPNNHIISLTVTEKGYTLTSDNRLDLNNPGVLEDLNIGQPKTVIGFLAYGLARRETPVTVLCCDNLSHNGDVLGQAVQDFAEAAGLEIEWSKVSFPNSMVDRITPATTKALGEVTGDLMAVATEPFSEWVIEDRFVAPRPDWQDVQFVSDVRPHEMRKLRMLNGAHSFLAYAGILSGYEFIHETVGDPQLRRQAHGLMREAAQTLVDVSEDETEAYASALLKRFENPDLKHRLRQIAMDGSLKIPYRWCDSLRALLADKKEAPNLKLALLRWTEFCRAEMAEKSTLQDPYADEIIVAATSQNPQDALLKMVGVESATLDKV
jgi:fructuronate reductase